MKALEHLQSAIDELETELLNVPAGIRRQRLLLERYNLLRDIETVKATIERVHRMTRIS